MHGIFGRFCTWVALASLPAFSVPSARAAAPSCTLRRIASVSAHVDSAAGLVVAGAIDGVPVTLVVDTGSTFSALTHAFAVRENLPLGRAHLDPRRKSGWPFARAPNRSSGESAGAGNPVEENVGIRQLSLGEAHSGAEQLAVLPGGGDGLDGRPVGMIGADYLSTHDLEFDSTDGKVNLFEPLSCAAAPVYWSNEYGSIEIRFDRNSGRITTTAELDGVPLTALIDTGSPVTAMPLATAERKLSVSRNLATLDAMPDRIGLDGVPIHGYRGKFRELVIGGLTVRHPAIALDETTPSGDFETGGHISARELPDLIVGINIFRKLRTIIAYDDGHIYYTKAEPALL